MKEHELRRIINRGTGKGYRRNDNGSYETFVSEKCKSINLGTYRTEKEAKDVVGNYRIRRYIENVSKYEEDVCACLPFENNYLAYPDGKIFNLHGEEMRGAVGRDGYRHVILNGKNVDVHRVIAKLFIPNPNLLEQVNHINGVKTDNRIENLEWCTRSDNLKHAYELGLEKPQCGENNHNHKLTYDDVRYIREKAKPRDRRYSYTALARRFGVDRTIISDVVNYITWRVMT